MRRAEVGCVSKECDEGTATLLFFTDAINWIHVTDFSEPEYQNYKDAWQTCAIVAKRWQMDDFLTHELAYHPDCTFDDTKRELKSDNYKGNFTLPDRVLDREYYINKREHRSKFIAYEGRIMLGSSYWLQKIGETEICF